MLSMLLAYDETGDVIATLSYMIAKDAEGNAVGLIDFDAHELAGGEMVDVWHHEGAKGSKTWPEWLGSRAHDFRIEFDGPPGRKRAAALVHKVSGHRRERATVEAAITERIVAAEGQPADIRDLVGGPDRPLQLDEQGQTIRPRSSGTPTGLPVVATER
jgi:hypothetical protein